MIQWVLNVPTAKPEKLNSMPESHMVEGDSKLRQMII